MTSAIATRTRGRGRQPAEVELARDYREELTAEVAESGDFALRILGISQAIRASIARGNQDHIVEQRATELGYLATRRLRQLGSCVL